MGKVCRAAAMETGASTTMTRTPSSGGTPSGMRSARRITVRARGMTRVMTAAAVVAAAGSGAVLGAA